MEIGEFILARGGVFLAWGERVAGQVAQHVSTLLKVPPQVRVKEVGSARAKQLRKAYGNPCAEMTDLVGTRFVVLTSDDIPPVTDFIERNAEWSAVRSRSPREEIADDPSRFGYQSHHYEVRPRNPIAYSEGEIGIDVCCEVQVRTILQHAYAELTHSKLYKTEGTVPSQAERLVARSMALMETTDELLCRAVKAVRQANEPALALQAVASDICAPFGVASSPEVMKCIMEGFRDAVSPRSAAELRSFVDSHGFVMDRIRGRLGRSGLFEFPDATLVTYWLANSFEGEALLRWPLPGTLQEVKLILSDLGVSAE